MRRAVLVLPGSFNPVTNSHLRLLEIARDYCLGTNKYTVLSGYVSAVSDHYQKVGLISAEHRLQMLRLAIKNNPWIQLDEWETKQNEWMTTAKVLQHFRRQSISLFGHVADGEESPSHILNRSFDSDGDDTDIKVFFVCGADVIHGWAKPGLWSKEDLTYILSSHEVIVINRSDVTIEEMIYESDILYKYRHRIHIVTDWFSNEVSSTKVRRAVRRGESIRYVVNEDVQEYIMDNNLYSESSTPDPGSTD